MQSTIQQNASASVFTGLQGYLSCISLHDVGESIAFLPDISLGDAAGRNLSLMAVAAVF